MNNNYYIDNNDIINYFLFFIFIVFMMILIQFEKLQHNNRKATTLSNLQRFIAHAYLVYDDNNILENNFCAVAILYLLQFMMVNS